MTPSLYNIEDALTQLVAMRDEENLTPEEREAIDQQIAEWTARELAKVDPVRQFIRHCEIMQADAGAEAKRLATLAKLWEARGDRMKRLALDAMQLSGKKKLEGKTGSLTVVGNGGLQALAIDNEGLIPDEYKTYTLRLTWEQWREVGKWFRAVVGDPTPSVDQAAVRAALGAGCTLCNGGETFPHVRWDCPNGHVLQVMNEGLSCVECGATVSETPTCYECDGTGLARVPGAHLEPRGVHLRVK